MTDRASAEGLTERELLDMFDRTAAYPGIRAAIRAVLQPDTGPRPDSDPFTEGVKWADEHPTDRASAEGHGVSGLFRHEPGAPCVVCDRASAEGLKVALAEALGAYYDGPGVNGMKPMHYGGAKVVLDVLALRSSESHEPGVSDDPNVSLLVCSCGWQQDSDLEPWSVHVRSSESDSGIDVERLAQALTTYAQIGDWLHGGISIVAARDVAGKLAAEYARLSTPRTETSEPHYSEEYGGFTFKPDPPALREKTSE